MRISNFAAVTVLVLAAAVGIVSAHAQTYSVLYNFGGKTGDPASPQNTGIIAQGRDGSLYSTSMYGGAKNFGAVFRISPAGTVTTLFSFTDGLNGGHPRSGLILGTNGNFYGTTLEGTSLGYGTVFKISPSGSLTRLWAFSNRSDGGSPFAPPIQGTDGNLYGTTATGGNIACDAGCGTIYKITLSGQLSTLYQFDKVHGLSPLAPLVQGTDGKFYGTTNMGGAHNAGVVFKITRTGKLTVIHSFSGQDGANPMSPLVQGIDGNFYGTTYWGGTAGSKGVVFKVTPTGTFTVLHNTNGTMDGYFPAAGLVQATDGNLYGSNSSGGSHSSDCSAPCGTVFMITPAGAYSVLYNFDGTSGADPSVTPVQHTKGLICGDTGYGGTGNVGYCLSGECGVFYSLDMGLGPFVSFVGPLSSGKVGKTIQILGQGFNGATAVSFNGTATSFTIKSDTFLTAIVPVGATTGFVTVTTPSGTQTSNKQFIVKP